MSNGKDEADNQEMGKPEDAGKQKSQDKNQGADCFSRNNSQLIFNIYIMLKELKIVLANIQ